MYIVDFASMNTQRIKEELRKRGVPFKGRWFKSKDTYRAYLLQLLISHTTGKLGRRATSAWGEGIEARRMGFRRDDCPYDPDTQFEKCCEWLVGYEEEKRRHFQECYK